VQIRERLLREIELDVDGFDGLQRDQRRAWREDLSQLDLPDAQPAVEGRADGFLGDGRPQPGDVGHGLLEAGFLGVDVRGGCVVALAQSPRAIESLPGQGFFGQGRGELRFLDRDVELDQHGAAPRRPAGVKEDLAHGAGQFRADDDAVDGHQRADGRMRRLPIGRLDLRRGDRFRRRRERLARLDHGADLQGLHAPEADDSDDQAGDDGGPDLALGGHGCWCDVGAAGRFLNTGRSRRPSCRSSFFT
jgi:hypothetical protein